MQMSRATLPYQELAKGQRASEQFSFKLEVKEAKDIAALAATTVSEAFLVGLILDTEVTLPTKKRKLEKEFKQMENHSTAFGADVAGMAHPGLISESTGLLLEGRVVSGS